MRASSPLFIRFLMSAFNFMFFTFICLCVSIYKYILMYFFSLYITETGTCTQKSFTFSVHQMLLNILLFKKTFGKYKKIHVNWKREWSKLSPGSGMVEQLFIKLFRFVELTNEPTGVCISMNEMNDEIKETKCQYFGCENFGYFCLPWTLFRNLFLLNKINTILLLVLCKKICLEIYSNCRKTIECYVT